MFGFGILSLSLDKIGVANAVVAYEVVHRGAERLGDAAQNRPRLHYLGYCRNTCSGGRNGERRVFG
jgi:hypothetical protein